MSNEKFQRPGGHGPMRNGRMGTGEKAKDFKGTVRKLIRHLSSINFDSGLC